jgi:hypothetical protein
MWHYFIKLPMVARIIGLLGVGSLALWGFLKHKAIAAFIGAAKDAASGRFWGYVREKLQTNAKHTSQPASNERAYQGVFMGLAQYENYPNEHCITLLDEHGGGMMKIPVARTNLLSGVSAGALVKIDTRPFSVREEAVVRVHVLRDVGKE